MTGQAMVRALGQEARLRGEIMKNVSQARMERVKQTKAARGRDVSKVRGEGSRRKIMIKMQRIHLRIKHLCL